MGRGQAPPKKNLNELKQELEIDVHKVIHSLIFISSYAVIVFVNITFSSRSQGDRGWTV